MTRTRRPHPSRSDGRASSRDRRPPPEKGSATTAPTSVNDRRPHGGEGAADTPEGVLLVASLVGDRLERGEGVGSLEKALRTKGATVWVDLHAPDPAAVGDVARVLGLHELIAEDIVEGNQRAKIEVTDDLIHIVLFALTFEDDVTTCEIDIVLGEGFLLTVHDAGWDPRSVTHLRDDLAAVMARGPDHLLWALVDSIVDGYFPVLDRIGDLIDKLEDQVISHATPTTLERVFRLKRELIVVRRAITPVREIFNQLTNRDLALIDEAEILWFRDVYDHLVRLTDEVDTYRDLVSGTLDVYLSTVSNNLSLIMKRLTGVTVVLTGIAALAGIFGMSEAGTALGGGEAAGFWLVTAFTIAAALLMAFGLRRIGWI